MPLMLLMPLKYVEVVCSSKRVLTTALPPLPPPIAPPPMKTMWRAAWRGGVV